MTDIHAYQIAVQDKPLASLDPEVTVSPQLVYHDGVAYPQPFLLCVQYVGGSLAPTCVRAQGDQPGSEVHINGPGVCCSEELQPRIRLQGVGQKASNDDGVINLTVSGRPSANPFECHSYSLGIAA